MPRRSPASCSRRSCGPGAPIVYGSFTSNVDMKSGLAGLRHARVRQGGVRRRPAGALHRAAVALVERDRLEHARRAGGLRVADEPVGRADRRLQLHPARRRLARERADHFLREVHPRHRDAADVRGDLPAGRRDRRRPRARARSPRSARAGTSSAARTRWSATAPRSTRRWSPTGATTASGPRTAAKTATERAHDDLAARAARYVAPPRDPGVVEALNAYVDAAQGRGRRAAGAAERRARTDSAPGRAAPGVSRFDMNSGSRYAHAREGGGDRRRRGRARACSTT